MSCAIGCLFLLSIGASSPWVPTLVPEPDVLVEIDSTPAGTGSLGAPAIVRVRAGTIHTIRGSVRGRVPSRAAVQIVTGRFDEAFSVLHGLGELRRTGLDTYRWSCEVRVPGRESVGCEDVAIRAGLTSWVCAPGPIGREELPRRYVALSAPRTMSICVVDGERSRARLRIKSVGRREAVPGTLLPVSRTENVAVDCLGIPPGVYLQLIVQPIDNPNRWAMSSYEVHGDGEWRSAAYLGRTQWYYRTLGGLVEVDTYVRFWVYAVATLQPLPVRESEGIGPDEWARLKPEIVATSQRVEVVRVVEGDVVRAWISAMGKTTDGAVRLVKPVERVEGGFDAGPTYLARSQGQEWILLARRRVGEGSWHVAGTTRLKKDRGLWIIPAADLGRPDAEYRAIAVVSDRPAKAGDALDSSQISEWALSISDEVAYRVLP